jgi:hypothetical protein
MKVLVRFLGSRWGKLTAFVAVIMALPLAAFAQTPVPPLGVDDIIASGTSLVTDFNLFPFITVMAVISTAVYLYARFRRSSR